ncbi:MAG: segregation/condensation protein A [Halodesulfurarchaeum sp.]
MARRCSSAPSGQSASRCRRTTSQLSRGSTSPNGGRSRMTEPTGTIAETEPVQAHGPGEPEPIEVLVRLAEEGQIDPWDIDIIQVTDAFLDALEEEDIRVTGRALFYASVLLRMKSDVLFSEDVPDEGDEPEHLDPFAADPSQEAPRVEPSDPIDQLEAEMERRLDRRSARGTPETLDELVRELREAERSSWWKSGRTYDTSESPRGFRRGVQTLDYRSGDETRLDGEPDEDDVTGTAHGEDIESLIEDVETALKTHYERGRPEVLFAEISDAAGSRVETFLAVLFLSHRGLVYLEQDDLFGDLWIQDRSLGMQTEEMGREEGKSDGSTETAEGRARPAENTEPTPD